MIRTTVPGAALGTEEVVGAYKRLSAVERVFRIIKSLDLLRCAGLTMALDTALAALRPVRLVTLELDGQQHLVLTKPTPHAQAVLKTVGLFRLPLPAACSETP